VPTDIIAPMMKYVRTMPLIDFFDYRCYRIWYVDYFCDREFLILSIILQLYLKKRITISIDEELLRKIRNEQARLVKKSVDYVSFSAVLCQCLMNGLRSHKTLTPQKS